MTYTTHINPFQCACQLYQNAGNFCTYKVNMFPFLVPSSFRVMDYRSHSTFSKTPCKIVISNVVSVSCVQGLQDLQGHFCITSMCVTFVLHSCSNLMQVNSKKSVSPRAFSWALGTIWKQFCYLGVDPLSSCCCTFASQKNLYKVKAFKVFCFPCPIQLLALYKILRINLTVKIRD